MGQALLLTGPPGVGKTTVVRRGVAELQAVAGGEVAGGFYTEEVRREGSRVGFRLVSLDGSKTMLATVNKTGAFRVGRYEVHLHELERVGVEALWRAIHQPQPCLVVVDEIGKMELLSEAFRDAVLAALNSPKPVLATVMSAPEPWVDALKRRDAVRVLDVTPLNRETLPGQILGWYRQVQGDGSCA